MLFSLKTWWIIQKNACAVSAFVSLRVEENRRNLLTVSHILNSVHDPSSRTSTLSGHFIQYPPTQSPPGYSILWSEKPPSYHAVTRTLSRTRPTHPASPGNPPLQKAAILYSRHDDRSLSTHTILTKHFVHTVRRSLHLEIQPSQPRSLHRIILKFCP